MNAACYISAISVISVISVRLKKQRLISKQLIIMKLFKKNVPAEKIGNFILTVITAFVSTFLMQSCMTL